MAREGGLPGSPVEGRRGEARAPLMGKPNRLWPGETAIAHAPWSAISLALNSCQVAGAPAAPLSPCGAAHTVTRAERRAAGRVRCRRGRPIGMNGFSKRPEAPASCLAVSMEGTVPTKLRWMNGAVVYHFSRNYDLVKNFSDYYMLNYCPTARRAPSAEAPDTPELRFCSSRFPYGEHAAPRPSYVGWKFIGTFLQSFLSDRSSPARALARAVPGLAIGSCATA
jgi:hypothetical protein